MEPHRSDVTRFKTSRADRRGSFHYSVLYSKGRPVDAGNLELSSRRDMFLRRIVVQKFAALLWMALAWGFCAVLAVGPAATIAAQSGPSGYASVSGQVIDAESGRPLADAHVFVASSMIGAITNDDGRFRLPRVPAGAHTLYVSMLGYAPVSADTLFAAGTSYQIAFTLHPTVIEGPEVTVSADRDPAWYKRLRKFTRLFVGESPNADECVIENPEVLSFDARWWGKLSAQAREPLVITNRALGYRVTYFLEEFESGGGTIKFDGEPLFEELEPSDSTEAVRWREERRKAYLGSFRHFMQSLVADTYDDEGFHVSRRYNIDGGLHRGQRFGFRPAHVLEEGPTSGESILEFHGYVDVVYGPESADRAFLRWQYGSAWHSRREQRSLIKLTDGPTRVDANGEVLDPYGVTVYGYFAYERLADLVPKDYVPKDDVPKDYMP